jgi:hypothetical protein
MLFQLAVLLGRTVGELETTMSSHELSEWMAFHRIRPLPDSYWQAGLIASTMANCWGASTTPDEFLPQVVLASESDRTMNQDLSAFSAFASAHNARLGLAS